jgi:hypothetical protein
VNETPNLIIHCVVDFLVSEQINNSCVGEGDSVFRNNGQVFNSATMLCLN